jgi:protein SCO1/2
MDLGPLPIGGNFSYQDKSHNLISLSNFKEPVILVFFGYTQCPDFCPNMLSKIKRAKALLSKEKMDTFRTVFISIDPTRDSSELVQKYMDFYLENSSGLSFNKEITNKIVKQYAAYFADAEDGTTIDHSTYVYVLDKDRKTRVLLKSNESAERFAEIISLLSGDTI